MMAQETCAAICWNGHFDPGVCKKATDVWCHTNRLNLVMNIVIACCPHIFMQCGVFTLTYYYVVILKTVYLSVGESVAE